MILVDTSVWIDHFHRPDPQLVELVRGGALVQHRLVTAELAMGNLAQWRRTVDLLDALPQAPELDHPGFLDFVAAHGLAGSGIGVVDAHLLASASAARAAIWTRDRRLAEAAERLGIGTSM